MAHVNVALIGYAFMGRAHSNAWRQVSRFFSTSLTPRMKVICGRDPKNVKLNCPAEVGYDTAVTVLKVNEAVATGKKIEYKEEDFKV